MDEHINKNTDSYTAETDYKDSASYKKGVEYFLSKYDPKHLELLNKLYAFSPSLADVVVSFGLYELWTQRTKQLTDREKEFAVLSSLITSCTVHSEIKAHTQCLLNLGVSKEQIKELLVLLTAYIGVPKVIVAANLVEEAFKAFDESQKKP